MRKTRVTLGLIAATALLASLIGPAQAMAASTTVTPAGDKIAVQSSKFWIYPFATEIECTLSGGVGTIPAAPNNYNPNGPVTINFTTRPTASCSGGQLTVNSFSLSLQGGASPTVTTNMSVHYLWAGFSGYGSTELGGSWQNGTTSPLVHSSATYAGDFITFEEAFLGGFPIAGPEYEYESPFTWSYKDTTNTSAVIGVS